MKTQDEIINALGGTVAVAEICGVTPSAISQWRNDGIPKPWLMFFKQRNPELFDDVPSSTNKEAA